MNIFYLWDKESVRKPVLRQLYAPLSASWRTTGTVRYHGRPPRATCSRSQSPRVITATGHLKNTGHQFPTTSPFFCRLNWLYRRSRTRSFRKAAIQKRSEAFIASGPRPSWTAKQLRERLLVPTTTTFVPIPTSRLSWNCRCSWHHRRTVLGSALTS